MRRAFRRALGPAVGVLAAGTACSPADDAPLPRAMFRDVSAETGLQFFHFPGATGQYRFIEPVGSGGALFDYDNDGDLDVYLIQSASVDGRRPVKAIGPGPTPGNRLYRNELVPSGELRFTDLTDDAGVGDEAYGMGVATGDIDGDGYVDLYVTNYGPDVLYRNLGNGSFEDVTHRHGIRGDRWSTSASFADVDHDGDLDLFVAVYTRYGPGLDKPCFASAGRRDYCGPDSYGPTRDRLYRNDGQGRFEDVSAETGIAAAEGKGLGVVATDVDGDGFTDVYVANDQWPNHLWMNVDGSRFEEQGLMSGSAYNADGQVEASMGLVAGDYDGDGDDDLFMTHLDGQTNTLYRNEGDGQFVDVTDETGLGGDSRPWTGFGVVWVDVENDGDLDLFIANGGVRLMASRQAVSDWPYEQPNQLFLNDGAGRFSELERASESMLSVEEVSRGVASGDIDNDGDVDLLVTNNYGPARLYLNEAAGVAHWLRVRLRATRGHSPDGAQVGVVRGDGRTLWRRIHTDGSYLSAVEPVAHFGLGGDPAIRSIVVRWPSGSTETFDAAGVNRVIVLVEGEGSDT